MPVFHATHSRLTALALGTLSGLSEPLPLLHPLFLLSPLPPFLPLQA
jgi:zinc transporter ZupT